MANENGRAIASLIRPFVLNGPKYGFYQSVRLLSGIAKSAKAKGLTSFALKIIPLLSLEFIGSDIESISYDENTNEVKIVVTFLALYGTASPLPTFYTEDLMLDFSEDITVSKDFLDIFHQILFKKLYDVWLKYRLNQCAFENVDNRYTSKLYYLIGLGDETLRKMVPEAKSLLKYIGLLNQQPRSAKVLEILLKDYFEVPIKIKSGYRSVQTIAYEQQVRLGVDNSIVGQETYLGSEIEDCSASIGISIGPLKQDVFNLFGYKQPHALALAFLINFFLNSPVKSFISIVLQAGEVRGCQLGLKEWGMMGQNVWVSPNQGKEYILQYQID